ncbi:hypothetical protein [Rhodobacter xanthinilyticus]|uniref:hypothetical protein n=1 Tax=Rhodobacter xanthinilyticus TaxID=1850250 RepID=UPI0012E787FD|nr:hypothetical protein [Rhodobacter xanthinilyticus]
MNDHKHEVHGIMCGHVHTNERPLRLIEHGPEGQWDFMCGEHDHDTQEAIDAAVVVCKSCAMTGYLLPLKVQELPANHIAELDAQTESWNVREMTAEEIAEYYED